MFRVHGFVPIAAKTKTLKPVINPKLLQILPGVFLHLQKKQIYPMANHGRFAES